MGGDLLNAVIGIRNGRQRNGEEPYQGKKPCGRAPEPRYPELLEQ